MRLQLILTAAQLLGNTFETLLYGIYIVTFCFCIQTLFLTCSDGLGEERWLGLKEIHWIMALTTFAFFILCTLNVAIGFFYDGYLFNQELAGISLALLSVGPNNIKWVNTIRVSNVNSLIVLFAQTDK